MEKKNGKCHDNTRKTQKNHKYILIPKSQLSQKISLKKPTWCGHPKEEV
jgi:hypothetical protein